MPSERAVWRFALLGFPKKGIIKEYCPRMHKVLNVKDF
jgi:hypothetical protein